MTILMGKQMIKSKWFENFSNPKKQEEEEKIWINY